jgi:phenylacetaldehyde dehydrogenase
MQAASARARLDSDRFFSNTGKRNLIGKDWVPALSGRELQVHDPSTGGILMNTPLSAREDVSSAVQAARRAFDQGPWTKMTPYERARIMLKIADLIEAHHEELAQIEAIDAGKPINQARYVDVPLTLHQFHFYAGVVTKIGGRTITPSCPYMPGTSFHAYTTRDPLGVVGLITPFNFPLLLGAMKIAPALAAGCTMVLKPDERAPGSLLRLAELALEAGLPEGVLNVVLGPGETGAALAAHDQVDKIAFTGSVEAGRSVLKAAAGNLKKVSLELGGNSPNIIFKDADLGKAIPGAAAAAYTNAGECCVAGARLYVEDAVYDKVVEGVIAQARALKIGPAMDDSTNLGPVITGEHLQRVLGYLDGARADGAKCLQGGKKVARDGYFLEPTVVTEARPQSKFMAEEVFGPVAKIVRFSSVDEVIAQSNDSVYGLAAGVWTQDVSKAHRVAGALKAGTVWVNCYNVFDTALPFGGYKQSGWARESCPEAIDLYTETKTVCLAL